ncbi:MAG: integrase arm-type DNA-binding domain-containing protein, partial [Xanthomonadales bacterium]|nr:integrase arm-type DNA-binding domain-containing protein [Xanthomonadales bacterium]
MAIRSTTNLTDTKVRHAKPTAKAYKLPDGDGLHLAVNPTGAKCWRYRYRIGGKENVFAIGEYPSISLREARSERDRARGLVKQGIHPAAERKARRLVALQAAEDTFEAVAKEWIGELEKKRRSAGYLAQVRKVLADDVFPEIGRLPIRSVDASQLLAILKKVEGRDASSIAILIGFYPEITDGCKRASNFRSCLATLRRILGLWNR